MLEWHRIAFRPAHPPMSFGTGLQTGTRATLADRPRACASRAKRAEDVVLAIVLLVLLAPLMLLIALAIRLETPGPAIFRQQRTGYAGSTFWMLKFRTMRQTPAGGVALRQATRRDQRVTWVGIVLRRTSLDELPQLFNVLRGEMSMVGPRPHAPGTCAGGRPFEQITPAYDARHRVRPGLTGLAQVRGLRGATETEDKLVDRLAADLEYIERWSLFLDLALLALTLVAVLRMKNAY